MKSIKTILLSLAAMFAITGCGETTKNNNPTPSDGTIVGEWHMVSWSNTALEGADVYLSFDDKGTFDLYQRLYKPTYTHYDGTYKLSGSTLSGTYSDGTAWGGTTYTVKFADNGKRLTLTRANNTDDVTVYAKESIPSYILSGEFATKSTADEQDEEPRFL